MSGHRNDYDAWHQRRSEIIARTGGGGLGPWHRTVQRLLPEKVGGRLLEIGAGDGEFAIALASRFPGLEIVAADFSGGAIELARSRAGTSYPNLEFRVEDAEKLSFAPCSFNYVVSCECIEHVGSPQTMAREIARVLKPGGSFILTTENYLNGCILGWMKHWLTGSPINTGSGPQPRENFFLFWMVRRYLRDAGLDVEHMESNHFQWLLLPSVSPDRLCTPDFASPFWRRVFRPIGRHFTFMGRKRPQTAAQARAS